MKGFKLLVPPLLALIGCVSSSDYDKLQSENEALRRRLSNLESAQERANSDTTQPRIGEVIHTGGSPSIASYSEEDALKVLKDWYEFYNADMIYRKPKVRRASLGTFVISLEECPKKGTFKNDDLFWSARVRTIRFNNDATYNID